MYKPRAQSKYRELFCVPRGQHDLLGITDPPRRIRLRLFIDYPLARPWEAIVELDHNGVGEIFAVAHDLYAKIYDLDDESWRRQGHDSAPRIAPGMMNRAQGEYVWGHDMLHLFFEGLRFLPSDDDEDPTVGTVVFGIGS